MKSVQTTLTRFVRFSQDLSGSLSTRSVASSVSSHRQSVVTNTRLPRWPLGQDTLARAGHVTLLSPERHARQVTWPDVVKATSEADVTFRAVRLVTIDVLYLKTCDGVHIVTYFAALDECATSGLNQQRSQPKIWERPNILTFMRAAAFCLGHRPSKLKTTRYARN